MQATLLGPPPLWKFCILSLNKLCFADHQKNNNNKNIKYIIYRAWGREEKLSICIMLWYFKGNFTLINLSYEPEHKFYSFPPNISDTSPKYILFHLSGTQLMKTRWIDKNLPNEYSANYLIQWMEEKGKSYDYFFHHL